MLERRQGGDGMLLVWRACVASPNASSCTASSSSSMSLETFGVLLLLSIQDILLIGVQASLL